MKIDTRQLRRGLTLLAVLALISCRSDKPPKISIICIGDGFGGADCALADGSTAYRAPSELKNYWMTTQTDEENFASWCYDAPASVVAPMMKTIKEKATVK